MSNRHGIEGDSVRYRRDTLRPSNITRMLDSLNLRRRTEARVRVLTNGRESDKWLIYHQ